MVQLPANQPQLMYVCEHGYVCMHIHTVHSYICTCVCTYVSMYLYNNVARVCGYLCEVVLVGWTKGLPEVRHKHSYHTGCNKDSASD